MPKSNKSLKVLYPALGIVFGAGVGMLFSILSDLHIATGMIGGAAVGLLAGLVVSNMFNKGSDGQDSDRA